MAKEEKRGDVDVLEKIKEVEKKKKAILLARKLGEIKDLARKVREAKKESELILEKIGIDKKDIKRIIDFVNELDETKLSEEDIDNLKKEIGGNLRREKEKIESDVRKGVGGTIYDGTSLDPGHVATTAEWTGSTSGGNSLHLCSDDGGNVKIEL